ncbi:MAG: acyltransferase [Inconstantimicrobium porci]|uniref:acyltransferase n=1 Tax=Inconstantimicrobium porci TaxID=2652291 RepID=UPI002A91313C|nr:acyltransferase [Inconstantimicrobium porci]MDY5912288.1 acyltransferase [Inconstantimicrobium porci]
MEKSKVQNQNINYISLASLISAIAVVFLHSNGVFWNFNATAGYWKSANIIESVFYFAVPVFFMISGVTLLDFNKRYNLKVYFSKRIHKTVIPYVFWSFIGLAFQIIYLKNIKITEVSVAYLANGLLSGKLVDIYWFFIPLFCLYLSIPLFAAVPKEKRKGIFTYLTAGTFILNCFIPFLLNLFKIHINYSLSIGVGSGYLIYIMLGYLLSKYDISKSVRYLLYLLAVLGLVMHMAGTYILSVNSGKIIDTFKGYVNVPCVLYSVGIFVLFRYSGEKIMKINIVGKVVNFLSKYTFSMYLIHWYILQIMIKELAINTKSIYYRAFSPFAVLIITVLFTSLIRKVPILRKILP